MLLIRTEEDKQAAKNKRMIQHFGLQKQSCTAPKLRTATNRLTTYVAPEEEITETESLKEQISEMQAQVAVMQTTTPRKAKQPSAGTSELDALKRQLAEIQAQVIGMMTAAHETNKEPSEPAEIKILKQQLAKLQAQVTTPPVSGLQTMTSSCSCASPRKTEHQSNRQSSTEKPKTNRPRPSYCFNCGEDRHLAVNCENEPNPVLVEEKRQLLKAKQQQWDRQNGVTGTQQLNY